MSGVDKVLASQEDRKEEPAEAEEQRRTRSTKQAKFDETVELTGSSSSSSAGVDDDFQPPNYLKRNLEEPLEPRGRGCGIFSSTLVSTLDRTQLSDRKATQVIAATAHALGHDIKPRQSLTCSYGESGHSWRRT